MDKEQLRKLLHESTSPVKLSFTKKDGTIRTMSGTTNLSLIDDDFHPRSNTTKSDSIITVFDADIQEWRCFIFDNLISVEHPTL